MPHTPVTVALMLDQSGSMRAEKKFPSAQTDLCTFVNIMSTGDSLSVIGFSTDVTNVFPASGVVPIRGQATKDAACQAVLAQYTLNETNIKAAVALAQRTLGSAATPRGAVLVSDGMWNVGGDPTQGLVAGIPVHTIALGETFSPGYLQSIASQTGGTYYYSPDARDLATIYDDIAAATGVAALVTAARSDTRQFGFSSTPAPIAAGTDVAKFAVSWVDPSIGYTPGTPTGRQLTARLIDPHGAQPVPAPAAVGPGFVVFDVPAPLPGTWHIEVWNSAAGGVSDTAAAFEPDSPTTLDLDLPRGPVPAGRPVAYRADVTHGEAPVRGVRFRAVLERPLRSIEESIGMHHDALRSVAPDPALLAEGVPEELARLSALRAGLPPGAEDPHPRVLEPLPPPARDEAGYGGAVPEVPAPGPYTVRLTAEGETEPGAPPFRRTRRVSFVAG